MAADDLAKMAFGVVQYLYRLGSLCVTIGLFLFVVMIFKPSADFGVIPFRLVLFGFGVDAIIFPLQRSRRTEERQKYELAVFIVGLVLLMLALIIPTRLYLMAYSYLK